MSDNETIEASTYLATRTKAHLKPFDWYLALVIAGVHEHKVGDDHAQRLRETSYDPDTDENRNTRLAALKALAAHGHKDYMSLL